MFYVRCHKCDEEIQIRCKNLIQNENYFFHEIGCLLCHLADLTVKVGMNTLPINIDQLFIDVFYHIYHGLHLHLQRKQEFANLQCSFHIRA